MRLFYNLFKFCVIESQCDKYVIDNLINWQPEYLDFEFFPDIPVHYLSIVEENTQLSIEIKYKTGPVSNILLRFDSWHSLKNTEGLHNIRNNFREFINHFK